MIKRFIPSENREKLKHLKDLNSRIRDCERCRLSLTRKHVLAGEGDLDDRLMLIAPLSYYATRKILTKYHADPPVARKDFSKKYGKVLLSDTQKILPLTPPATLLYNPSFELKTIEKYQKLQILVNECKWYSLCPMKRFYEAGRLQRKWIELYCDGDWSNCVRYEMKELGHYHYDWMLTDGSLDENLKEK